jgi:hypothetical protein
MRPGDFVVWEWGNGLAQGIIKAVRHEPVTITSKGRQITRNGTSTNPALIIAHKSGNEVLKLASEVQRSESDYS